MPERFGLVKWIGGYKPKSRLGRFVYRMVLLLVVLLVLGETFKPFHALGLVLSTFVGFVLLIVLLFMGVRHLNQRLLWKVRNRLILTYLLMGLAPVVLFGTITLIAAYIFAGQYATNSAITILDETERRVQDETNTIALDVSAHTDALQGKGNISGDFGPGQSNVTFVYLQGGMWHALPVNVIGGSRAVSPFAEHIAPSWMEQHFDGIMALDGRLYLCSLALVRTPKGITTVLGSMPIQKQTLDSVATGLGRILILPVKIISRSGSQDITLPTNVSPNADQEVGEVAPILRPEGVQQLHMHHSATRPENSPSAVNKAEAKLPQPQPAAASIFKVPSFDFNQVYGGSVPPSDRLFDVPVKFSAPLPVISWESGDVIPAVIGVVSRPTVLYTRLFATSVMTGSIVKIGLIVISILFALLELFSLFMAVQLSRTITESVYELYQGTTEIDRGNLAHRIAVKQKDQLGALSHSFNAMAASIQDLLVQQREADRLLNELMIAQEVQKNLFPASPIRSGSLEVHALCMPARTVSGDYYDYIAWDDQRLCIALGDISGKGISAALLMASLNSAVRAFTLGNGDGTSKAPSPAGLLTCLNRHLYRSTTAEKYATLFIAVFDAEKNTLTYSNGGHLPPLVLSSDGSVQRLECGGAVVGLLDNLQYEEATVQLREGDLLVAYSDGLTEPEQGDEEFGEDRLRDFVQANGAKDLRALASESIGTVKKWIGDAEQPDDMTILLARYT